MQDSSAGALVVVEDFQPITDRRALITAGSTLRDLHTLGECTYEFYSGGFLRLKELEVMISGRYLRLGNLHKGQLIYSDGWECPHQPFKSDNHFYYSFGAPKASIYRDALPFIVSGGDFLEVGKAFEHEGLVYFEANKTAESPDTWEIWVMNPESRYMERIALGANPAIYNGTLYFDRWNGNGGFDVVTRPV